MNDIIKISSWIKPYIPHITNDNISKLCATQDVECLCAYLVDFINQKQTKIFSKQCKIKNEQEILKPHIIKDFNYEINRKIDHCKQCKYSKNPNIVSIEQLSSGFTLFLIVSSENAYFFNENGTIIREFNHSMERLLYHYKMECLNSKINKIESGPRIGISEKDGTFFCYSSEIIYCEADKNYTCLFFRDGSKKLLAKSLSRIEKNLLKYDCFIKIHKSTIVNKNYIVKIQNNTLHMDDGSIHEIALRRRNEIKKKLTIL